MSSQNQPKMTKAERTAAAREQARLIREAAVKKQKRNGWFIRGGVVIAALAIIAVVTLIVVTTMQNNAPIANSGPVPANANAFGGVTIGKDGKVTPPAQTAGNVDTNNIPTAAAAPTPTGTASAAARDLGSIGIKASAAGQPVSIVVYIDFICPVCKVFETANASVLKEFADQGKVTFEYRPTGLLDQQSTTNYSSRAAAAAACVANNNPEKYLDFFTKLYENQPSEGSAGLSNDQLKQYAKDLGANIDSCVDDRTYRPLVNFVTKQAGLSGINATPTIYVDGQKFEGNAQAQFTDFKAFVQGIIDAKAAKK
ncbi:DsbA family protein [Psychromicrobium sp. YIM B11713]|uniref:DsbA family protein n=1 Tax=Psychromicrobium sp. YIM B11713 TaxID=3145233 RepID=UPI00374E691A